MRVVPVDASAPPAAGVRLTRLEWASLGALGLLAFGTPIVPWLARRDPLAIGDVLSLRLMPPFATDSRGDFHLLGTDRFGRDLFVRMMLAGRLSLAVGVIGSVFAAGAGTIVGAAAAWWGGAVDGIAMALADALLSVPRLVLLLVC